MYDKKHSRCIFAVISLTGMLCSTGCTVMQSVPEKIANPMTGSFTAEVTVTDADSESKAVLTRYGTEAWCVVFSEPQSLAGVQLDFLDDDVKASYKGLEFSVPQSAQAIRTELENLMNIIDDMALSPDLEGKHQEDKIICEGAIQEGSYSLLFTPEGIPEEFSLPCYQLKIRFDSFAQEISSTTTETTIPVVIESETIQTETESLAEEAVIPETVPAEPAAVVKEAG